MPNMVPGGFALQDIPMCQKYKKRTCCLLTAGSFYTETEIPVGGGCSGLLLFYNA